eukprot:6182002-Pleurochrysis_carterae.AAC.1
MTTRSSSQRLLGRCGLVAALAGTDSGHMEINNCTRHTKAVLGRAAAGRSSHLWLHTKVRTRCAGYFVGVQPVCAELVPHQAATVLEPLVMHVIKR